MFDFKRISAHIGQTIPITKIVEALYLGLLGRPADSSGLDTYVQGLRNGIPLQDVIASFVQSKEFRSRSSALPDLVRDLPDLTQLQPERYERLPDGTSVLKTERDEDFRRMESLIAEYRYYDSFGVWSPKIDPDKQITAAIVAGLGAKSCIEFGCFNGPVLSLLQRRGIEVCGVELSHLACLLAFPNVHRNIRFGSLLDLRFDRQYDVFLAMDIFEHLSQLDIDQYIARAAQLVQPEGFLFMNSPMFGPDDVFGTVATAYLAEWQTAGDTRPWRHMHCDAKGWPMHGHLVWASPRWWEALLHKQGLVRDRELERTIHAIVAPYYAAASPTRRSFFLLRHAAYSPDHVALTHKLATELMAAVPGFGD